MVSIGTLVLTTVSTLAAHRRNRIANELEWRSRREQIMRMLQWAADLAIDPDPHRSAMGLRQLQALARSRLNSPDVQAFVNAALDVLNPSSGERDLTV